ncbi:hypothetical protein BKG70_19985 [Mycobacteroides chelonae]|nr:hypothetical protein BKG66_21280 [Mycobacteroides chelonae]OHT69859.1 hypothetical protein BKG67_19830 [Mycobacteroides chelonae]OHT84725.1 hypothetical protein BKG70_19985 [Mycobacteroides chelonae]
MKQVLDLVGKPGSREAIPTPAAVIELSALRHNLESAAEICRSAGVAVRPHAKTHKSGDLAHLQLEAGAVGVCVAKVGEAEALFGAGVDNVLVTSPIVSASTASRACELADAGAQITVVVDHLDGVAALAAATVHLSTDIAVLIDIDVGLHRTGAPSPEQALQIAQAIDRTPGIALQGVQGYGGHWQHITAPEDRRSSVAQGMEHLLAAIDALDRHGFDTRIRTGGGTGTLDADLALGVLTELQPGSYVVMDRQYGAVHGEWIQSLCQALFVVSTVTKATESAWLTVDAGLKAFATDAGVPGSDVGSYAWFGDEQGILVTDRSDRPALGARIDLTPPHCDPTIDHYDVLHVVDGDVLVDLWPVHARGRSQ